MRKLLLAASLLLGCAAGFAQAPSAEGGAYPSRPIRIIAPGPAGAATDLVTRAVADKLAVAMGQPMVVDNKAGANGMIAVRTLMAAKPDGYTIALLYSDSLAISPYLVKAQPFEPIKDITYIATIARTSPLLVVVHPSVPAQNFADLVKLARSAPKRVKYSTYGIGSAAHLGFEMLGAQGSVDWLHVPYKGGPQSYQAVLAGEVDMTVMTSTGDYVRAGKVRALAVSGRKRLAAFPEVPSLGELGYSDQVFAPVVFGFAAPVATPPEIISRLAEELRKVSVLPEIAQSFGVLATEPYWMDGPAYRHLIEGMISSYVPVIRRLGITID